MLPPTKIKDILNNVQTVNDSEYFFKTHIHLEGYVKRVLLIGLRLKGVQYENSEKIVDIIYLNTKNIIEKSLWLVDGSDDNQTKVLTRLKSNYIDFFVLKETVLDFSAVYRNRLAHGTIEKLNDQEEIDWLCHVNKSFFQSFEHLLQ